MSEITPDPLTPQRIRELLAKQRERNQYIKTVAELLGVTEEQFREQIARETLVRMEMQAKLPRRARQRLKSRKERIEEVLLKRYNVPPQLLNAYQREVEPDYDW